MTHEAKETRFDRLSRPSIAEILPMVDIKLPNLFTPKLPKSVATINDMRARASRMVPKSVFDYVDGSAGDERTYQNSLDLFQRVRFTPKQLRGVDGVDLSTNFVGVQSPVPFALAPTGFTRLMHHMGELAVARAASSEDIIYTLSTMGTISPDELASYLPGAKLFFQLYVWRDRSFTLDLLERVKRAGYRAIMLTIDTATAGLRYRDERNGFSIPPKITPKTIADMALHPRWWINLLVRPPLEFATLTSTDGTVSDLVRSVFDPRLNFDDLAFLRESWEGPIVVKGVQSAKDAETISKMGVEALLLSNHGGRQLDRSLEPLRLVEPTRQLVGDDAQIFIDGGIRSGSDILAALAFGADGVFIGRPYLYGLMANGQEGVKRVIEILKKEITVQMQLLGVSSLSGLDKEMVKVI
ncbi:MAG: alpha-hydroxy acid oxidase [Actinomycetota bacterium]|nr:alpha-hydroxy acid oxidase [Actinomycetota bacterium]